MQSRTTQSNPCHSQTHATVKPMPQSNPCHSQTHATVKPMPQSNPCHSQPPLTFADKHVWGAGSLSRRKGRIGWHQGWQGPYNLCACSLVETAKLFCYSIAVSGNPQYPETGWRDRHSGSRECITET